MEREKIIVRTSFVGIAANVLLVIFKATIGLISGSIAIILDAVNNLSDVLSSVITIVGTKLAGKRPDKDHPLGHGRSEYLAGLAVAVIILLAGGQALMESGKKIIDPGSDPDYSVISLVIIGVAVLVKVFLGLYVRKVGKSVNSSALTGSGTDALMDAIVSTSVLISALLFFFFKINIEAYVGIIISFFIIKAGIDILIESKDDILGRRADDELKEKIIDLILTDETVTGAYDLFLHNYGHSIIFGSVHVEIPDTMTAEQIDLLERKIAHMVMEKYGVIMTAIGIYSVNSSCERTKNIREDINRIVYSHEGVLQTHGFYLNEEKKTINLDIILDFSVKDREELFQHIRDEIQENYPEYKIYLVNDIDV